MADSKKSWPKDRPSAPVSDTPGSITGILRDLTVNLQSFAAGYGSKLNKLASEIDGEYEHVIVGTPHRAAGILLYYTQMKRHVGRGASLQEGKERDVYFLAARFNDPTTGKSEYQIPGGKAQGTEYPLETAVREFNEETLGAISEDIYSLHEAPQMSHCLVEGKYTLFLVDLSEVSDCAPEDVIDKFNIASLHSKMKGKAKLPISLEWLEYTTPPNQSCCSFAKTILSDPGIARFMKKLTK